MRHPALAEKTKGQPRNKIDDVMLTRRDRGQGRGGQKGQRDCPPQFAWGKKDKHERRRDVQGRKCIHDSDEPNHVCLHGRGMKPLFAKGV